ncbi:Mating-type protein beta1-1 [Psilocybe cubensis]|uniref:Mating-type protein beta1-1 n=2 Tax=Psilocybe cubensis TaxID=181762 RepID=A0ACB8HH72_PSICU|nr:Mating-type protein beta1-1 [Psilocybe cubensis]KAH9486514.1 Mating-type protein beta1-1 [Psilocybe cubensis]
MDPHLDSMLNGTVQEYSATFLSALQGDRDNSRITSFLASLTSFTSIIRSHHKTLHEDTLNAVYTFFSFINSMTSSIIDLEKEIRVIGGATITDLSKIIEVKMSNLTLEDHSTTLRSAPKSHPAYIKPSYEWLLNNLHNPYPSKDVKKDIIRQTNCSSKDIDAWFVDIRKRIGWNHLRKTRFSNKQEKIIAAATSIFKPKSKSFPSDPNTILSEMDPTDAFRAEFLVMARKAKSLYANKFPESIPADLLDTHNLPVIPVDRVKSNPSRSYPTPEPSSPSHSPSPVPDEELASVVLPVSCVTESRSRKRRYSTSESDSESYPNGSSKKSRTDTWHIPHIATASLPSPASSIDLSEDASDDIAPLYTSATISPSPKLLGLTHSKCDSDISGTEGDPHSKEQPISGFLIDDVVEESIVHNLKRKRRLSDGEGKWPNKRAPGALLIPRLQTVSNPLPMTNSFADELSEMWNQDGPITSYDFCLIPSPAHLENNVSLDCPLEVCYGQYDLPDQSLIDQEAEVPLANLVPAHLSVPSYYPESLKNSEFDVAIGSYPLPDTNDLIPFSDDDLLFSIQHNPNSVIENSSMGPDWSSLLQSGDPYLFASSLISANTNTYVTSPQNCQSSNVINAKRAKIKALNEQIRQLEAEL